MFRTVTSDVSGVSSFVANSRQSLFFTLIFPQPVCGNERDRPLRLSVPAGECFVLFVPVCPSDADRSFVVKQFYTSVRVLAFDPFSLVTHSE